MGRILTIVLLFIHFNVSAQKTVTVRKETKADHKYQSVSEKYHVLKDDRSVMHGLYEMFDYKNNLVTAGYYKQGKRDSTWTEYNVWGHFVAVEGHYSEGKKVGIWTFYEDADTIELKYDYNSNKVRYFKTDTAKKYAVIVGTDTITTTLERPPLYLGGSGYISRVISNNLNFPDEARESNIDGRVVIAFTIYPDGRASAPWIFKSVHKSLDDEALSVAAIIAPNWLPGMKDGKPVTSIYVLPMVFKLE